ncbi:regulatory protein GemA [Pseudodesulfovibrio sp.]|uniref:regulatory protein GemA n=1 Tax=unclassified Pseudodesulfovibrio TaxID=2661612 RepID=UPI003B00E3B0
MQKNSSWRNALLAKIHIAKKQMPNMDDDLYRDKLNELYGKDSAGKLTIRELTDFVNFLEKKGAEFPHKGSRFRQPRQDFYEIPDGTPYAEQKRRIAAMWRALEWKMSGLDIRCKTQFRVEKFLWLNDQSDLQVLAKDLIGRCHRKGIDPDDAQPAQ